MTATVARRGGFERRETFSRKFCKKPLAFFSSWGIFLPVAGDDGDDSNETLS